MVIRGNRGKFNTSIDEEVDQRRFHFGLTGLEVVTTDKGLMTLGKFDTARDESVLRRAVDEWNTFFDTGNCEDGRRRNLIVAGINGFQEILGGVINSGEDISVAFSIGGPKDDDFIKTVVCLKCTTIGVRIHILRQPIGG